MALGKRWWVYCSRGNGMYALFWKRYDGHMAGIAGVGEFFWERVSGGTVVREEMVHCLDEVVGALFWKREDGCLFQEETI